MKTKLTAKIRLRLIIAVLLGFLTLAFAYRNSFHFTEDASAEENIIKLSAYPPTPVNNNISTDFLIGAMTDGWQTDGQPNGYSKLRDTLGFNLWHRYISGGMSNGQFYLHGWTASDEYDAPINNYRTEIQNILGSNENNGMLTLMERPKIERLAFGQRSDYQCEATNIDPMLWFYSYKDHPKGTDVLDDDPNYGESNWVRYCTTNNSNDGPGFAGYVVTGLKANREQVNSNESTAGDKAYSWIIKPKIRADMNYINNPSNYDNPICRIEVLNYDGTLIKNVELKSRHFKPSFSTNYDGKYKEEQFRFEGTDPTLTIPVSEWENINPRLPNGTYRSYFAPDGECKVDYKVYWYGNCDMWIDYVRLDNDVADELFKGVYDNTWISWEANDIGQHGNSPLKFYIEEFEFNNLPCMAYVSRKLRDVDPRLGLMCDLNYTNYNTMIPFTNWDHVFDNFVGVEHINRFLIDSVGSTEIFMGSYPFGGGNSGSNAFEQSPLPVTIGGEQNYNWKTGMLGNRVSVKAYEDTLQAHFDNNQHKYWSYREWTARADSISRIKNIPFINLLQTHMWYSEGHQLREPTNEELDLMSNLAISYGARGMLSFWYEGWGCIPSNDIKDTYGRGLTEPLPCATPNPLEWLDNPHTTSYDARTLNVYGQNKWQKIINMNKRFKKWSPTLMSFDNTNRHSYIYRLENEREALLSSSYFRDIVSYEWGSGAPPCEQDRPDTTDAPNPPDVRYECNESRYLQAATFKITGDVNRYFMIVNRRCSPLQPITHNDGARYMRVIFDQNSGEFATYNSWNIVDVEFNTLVGSFDKTSVNPCVDLKWFKPGEGKLFKVVPVLPSGGMLAGDENLSGVSFTCEAPVYNNGHNITIGANTTIHFNDSSRFVMNGGVFTVGDQNTSGSQNITSDAVTGSTWLGHSFTNCEVNIYGTTFTGLTNDTTYALNFIDCPVVDIRGCTFNSNSSLKGAINTVCFSNPFLAINNVYIGGNTFNSSGSTIPTVNVSSYAGITTPLIIENNTFNEGNTAIFLNGVTGGAIKGNTITDNYIGINALTSSVDIAENTISSSINSSTGIFSAGGSEIRLCKAGNLAIGGYNSITNTGGASNNINVTGAYFLMSEGKNVFDITSNQSSNHLNGYFPYFTAVSYNEQENCFKVDNSPVDPPINYVTDGYQGSQITFTFTPYLTGCEVSQCQDYIVVDLGGGVYDTICNGSSGSGGGQSNLTKIPLSRGVTRETGRGVFVVSTAKTIPPRRDFETTSQFLGGSGFLLTSAKEKYDSLCVLIRYRNFTQAKTKCLDLINTYPDSIQSLNAISKLFLASVATDTSYNAANELKTFYENLILNHGNNVSLVKRVNYFILKCKVRMHEYSQAMAGFQQIINLNPYSYEGLIARWDYMATSLLVQGVGGGERGDSFGSAPTVSVPDDKSSYSIDIVNALQNEESDDDRSPFTKEQRKDIRKSIITAIEISKNDDETKMKTLEVKSQLGDVNASKELSQMKTLKQVVKTEKPKSILEHVKIVSEDIRKVFGSNTSSKGNEPKNIPAVFRLSQNYPNPFNPTTKINYDLPRDSKVNIVIYDILGREVKRLLNNELKSAGSYIIDFNASNYASGVYFYRIEAEEPNGNKFVDSKKMVLLK